MRLTDDVLMAAQADIKPVKLFDGAGLFLLVSTTGRKWWRFKYRFAGKEAQLSLGEYPALSIAEARAKLATYRAMLAEGADPRHSVVQEKALQRSEALRQAVRTRFMLDSDGALFVCLGSRRVALSPDETSELRTFLATTQQVAQKVKPCL